MKRSGWVMGITGVQLLLALSLVGITIYLFTLVRLPDAAVFLSPIAMLYLAAVYGLWKEKLWGWWLGFLLNVGVAGALLYNVIDEGWRNSDAEDIVLPFVFVALLVLFAIPAVRGHYWGRGDSKEDVLAIHEKHA
jgi:peptidoglycan/LPS O-acetylase OafA/YrhL